MAPASDVFLRPVPQLETVQGYLPVRLSEEPTMPAPLLYASGAKDEPSAAAFGMYVLAGAAAAVAARAVTQRRPASVVMMAENQNRNRNRRRGPQTLSDVYQDNGGITPKLEVVLEDGENIENALRRFRRMCNNYGHLRRLRLLRTFEDNHTKKIRKAKETAMNRARERRSRNNRPMMSLATESAAEWHQWMQSPAPARAEEDIAMLGLVSSLSTKKRVRQAEKSRAYNRSWKSRMKTEIKKLETAVEEGEVDSAKAQFPTTVSVIQKVVRRGIIHKNKGNRLVSKLHLKYKRLTEPEYFASQESSAPVAALAVQGAERVPAVSMSLSSFTGEKPQHVSKAETVKSIKILLDDSAFVFGIPNADIEGNQIVSLRKSMPEGTTAKCVKNTLMSIACEGTEWAVVDPLLKKANLWFFIDSDTNIKETIQAVQKWSKDTGKTETHAILGGVLSGALLDEKGVDAVSKLPSKQELMAKIARAIQEAGAARIVRLVNQVPTKVARSIKLATEEKEETIAALAVGEEVVEGAAEESDPAMAEELVALLEEAQQLGAPVDEVLESAPEFFQPSASSEKMPPRDEYVLEQQILAAREKYRLHPSDCGSSQIQIAEATVRINHLTAHMTRNKKDYSTLRGMIAMVNRRRKLLDYLWKEDAAATKELVASLGIRYRPKESMASGEGKYDTFKRKLSKYKVSARKVAMAA